MILEGRFLSIYIMHVDNPLACLSSMKATSEQKDLLKIDREWGLAGKPPVFGVLKRNEEL